jgi:hypothetical protein
MKVKTGAGYIYSYSCGCLALKGLEGVLAWTATCGAGLESPAWILSRQKGEIVTTGDESNNWTRDASNPAILQTGRLQSTSPATTKSSPLANMFFIRVNPFDPHNPCDYYFVYYTHRLKPAERPDESSVTIK